MVHAEVDQTARDGFYCWTFSVQHRGAFADKVHSDTDALSAEIARDGDFDDKVSAVI